MGSIVALIGVRSLQLSRVACRFDFFDQVPVFPVVPFPTSQRVRLDGRADGECHNAPGCGPLAPYGPRYGVCGRLDGDRYGYWRKAPASPPRFALAWTVETFASPTSEVK